MNAVKPDKPNSAAAASTSGGRSVIAIPVPNRYNASAKAGSEYANKPHVHPAQARSPDLAPHALATNQSRTIQDKSITLALKPQATEATDPYEVGSVASVTSTPSANIVTNAKAAVVPLMIIPAAFV
jgi:hypothetical protein